MTLTLTLANVDRLENGETTQLVLDRHGALIGRSPNADWSLPDPKKYISFTHCEIVYRGGEYLLVDKSTNGTFVNGSSERLTAPHALADGDEILVGHYRVAVRLASAAGAPAPQPKQEAQGFGWGELPEQQPQRSPWDDLSPPPAKAAERWPQEDAAAITGRGAMSESWAPPRVDAPAPPPANNVWARYESVNSVNWDSAGFGAAPQPAPAPPPPSPARSPAPSGWADETPAAHPAPWPAEPHPATPAASDWPAEPRAASPAPSPWPAETPAAPPHVSARPAPPVPAQPSPMGADEAWNALLRAAGLTPQDLKTAPSQAGAAAGSLLRRLVGGLVVMLEARARAKAELGATATMIEVGGNNPLKFLRQPEAALSKLLNPAERGFMDADRAVEDAFKDLQAHQMASLAAMQGALRATLERFSPSAIRGRAEGRGLLSKILPAARDAALWQAYEREFEGVVKGSDEAFMDFFAKAFRDAYQKASAEMKRN